MTWKIFADKYPVVWNLVNYNLTQIAQICHTTGIKVCHNLICNGYLPLIHT